MATCASNEKERTCAQTPGESGARDNCPPGRPTIALRYRATQIFVDVVSFCGGLEIDKVCRIPGAAPGVKGLVLFRGEPIPLLSFFGGSAERSPRQRLTQTGKTDDYAVVLSVSGIVFAARVDEPPRMCENLAALGKTEGKTCYMRKRHLEQLVAVYVDHHRSAEHDCSTDHGHSVEHDGCAEHNNDMEEEPIPVTDDVRCATRGVK